MTPDLKWLTDPTVFAVNRLDAHSDHVCYRSEAEIRLGGSSLRQSLDGRWRFAYSACPAARPADFYREDADLSAFGTICVPGHIELQAYVLRGEPLPKKPVVITFDDGYLSNYTLAYPILQKYGTTPPSAAICGSSISMRGCAGSASVSAFRGPSRHCMSGATATSSAMPRTALPPRNLI